VRHIAIVEAVEKESGEGRVIVVTALPEGALPLRRATRRRRRIYLAIAIAAFVQSALCLWYICTGG